MTDLQPPRFRLLLLDDEEDAHEQAHDELDPWDVDILSAYNIDEAKEKLDSKYIDVAFVDLFGNGGGTGVEFMRHLDRVAPHCPIFVVTKYTERWAGDVLELIGSGANVRGISNKVGEGRWFAPFVQPLLNQWRANDIVVHGLDGEDGVVAALLEKRGRINKDLASNPLNLLKLRREPQAVCDEVTGLVRAIFGGTAANSNAAAPILSVRVLRKGYSSSVVVEALPSLPVEGLDEPVAGNLCVIKLGPRNEIATEAQRYGSVVRFGVALEYRVELLGHALGDALGAICYSFAGAHATDELRSLDDIFREATAVEEKIWRSVFAGMFDANASNWYSISGEASSLLLHFKDEYKAELGRCHDQFDEWLTKFTSANRSTSSADSRRDPEKTWWRLKVCDKYDLVVPRKAFLANRGLTKRTPGSLIHGDLHGGNILVDASGDEPRFRFIDYRNSGFGPRLLDFSALHASVRLAHADKLMADNAIERPTPEALELLCSNVLSEEVGLAKGNSRRDISWAAASRDLDAACRANFADATDAEALWTSFAYCLSMYRITQLGWAQKFRLLLWMSALTDRLGILTQPRTSPK